MGEEWGFLGIDSIHSERRSTSFAQASKHCVFVATEFNCHIHARNTGFAIGDDVLYCFNQLFLVDYQISTSRPYTRSSKQSDRQLHSTLHVRMRLARLNQNGDHNQDCNDHPKMEPGYLLYLLSTDPAFIVDTRHEYWLARTMLLKNYQRIQLLIKLNLSKTCSTMRIYVVSSVQIHFTSQGESGTTQSD